MSTSNNTFSTAGQPKSNVQNSNSKAKISKNNESSHEVDISTLNDKLDQNLSQIAHCIDRIKAIDLALQDENNLLSSVEIEKLQKDKEKKLWARDGFGTQRLKLHREVEELQNTPGKNNKKRQKQKMRKLAGLKESKMNEDVKGKRQKEDNRHIEGRGNDEGEGGQNEEVDEADETDSSIEFIICSPARFKFAVPAIPSKESGAPTSAARPEVAARESKTPTDTAGPEITAKESETFTYTVSPEEVAKVSVTPTGASSPEVADNE